MRFKYGPILLLISSLILLLLCCLAALCLGAVRTNLQTIWNALFNYHASHISEEIIREIRLPRVLGAALVGASLAVSGALMQTVTRNPLADSGLLGINAGAALMLTICFAFFPKITIQGTTWFSICGAALAAALVFAISRINQKQSSPVRMVLAGMAISTCLIAISEGLALVTQLKQDLAFWHFGGVSAVSWTQLKVLGPILILVLLFSLCLGPSLSLLQFDDDVILGLGKHPDLIRGIALLCVVVLAGISVALVGSVAFVGLIIPHIVRYLIGSKQQLLLPLTITLGATLVVLSDLVARVINPPQEIPFGIIISLIGVPFFIFLARREGKVVDN